MSQTVSWRRWLPVLDFWQGPRVFTADLIAGTTVGLVLVPQAMAYAALAGAPPIAGLYAGSFACMAGALFGRCPQLQTGPVAMTALLSMAAVAPLAPKGSAEFMALLATLALMVGILRIALGLLKGAALVALISKPVLSGFATAAGITIASTQVPKIFGNNPGFSNPIINSLVAMVDLGKAHWPSIAFGLGSLAAMITIKKLWPRLPNLLIAMAAAGVLSWLLDYAAMGGAIVGELPQGLPPWALPDIDWALVPALLSGAAVVVVIGLLEVMTVTSAAERMHGQRPDLNGELVGQGASSIVAGLNAGFPVSGSLSRSSLNLIAGGRTGFSSIVAGGIVLLTLLFLTPLLKPLPYPALAAAIVMAVAALVRPQDLITAWRIRTSDGLFGALTAIITIALAPDMVMGIGAGLAMSIGYGLWRSMHPRAVITTPDADGRRSAAADQKDPTAAITTGRLVVRIDTRISHLNATLLRDRLLTWLGRCPSGTELVIDCCAINDIDVTGCDMLAEVADQAIHRGCRFALADLKAPVRKRIERSPGLVNLPILARVDDDFPDILAERPVFADGI